jgi:hypothetical protein
MDIHATISLSMVSALTTSRRPNPHIAAIAVIKSWTFHTAGGEGQREFSSSFEQNAISIVNCARITFELYAEQAVAIAQINVFTV